MHSHRKVRTAALALVAMIITGCVRKDGDTGDSTLAKSASAVMAMVANQPVLDLVRDSSPGFAYTTEMTGILGYNDEQSFEGQGNKPYGPIARLYALHRTRGIAEYQRPEGAMVAVLEVDPNTTSLSPAYTLLGIQDNPGPNPQVYCVFLFRATSGSNPWSGAISKATGSNCAPPTTPHLRGDSIAAPGYENANDLPEYSVRFTEDNSGRPALGVRCLNAICEIGHGVKENAPGGGRKHAIKTWNDRQKIAEEFAPGEYRRGPLASIVPVDNLENIPATTFGSADGAHVATISITGPAPTGGKYAGWGLAADKSTEVWIRRDAASQYWGQFITDGNKSQWLEMFRVSHDSTKIRVPAAARWLWDPADEGVWIACEQGCCELGSSKRKKGSDSLR